MTEEVLRIGFIGAGAIHFGVPGVPWAHADRLEKIGNIQVVGIADPDVTRAQGVLQKRRKNSEYGFMYKDCKVFSNGEDLLKENLDAVFLGIPPLYRGSVEHDLELKCVSSGVNLFVEKPLSVVRPEEFEKYSRSVTEACEQKNTVLSVGYMFRYHAAVLKMKELIKQHGGKVMAFNARYYFAYTSAINKYWFNSKMSGGPIVEQATHFIDIARFLVGDVDQTSISTIFLKETEDGDGTLKHLDGDYEDDIKVADRIPRVTMSHWRFLNGGVGTLMHSIALPGNRYEANIDVQLDGLKLSLVEPYTDCILKVRDMKSLNEDVVYDFGGTDCYHIELETFIKSVRQKDQSLIQSSYADASKTYNLSWAIVDAGEKPK